MAEKNGTTGKLLAAMRKDIKDIENLATLLINLANLGLEREAEGELTIISTEQVSRMGCSLDAYVGSLKANLREYEDSMAVKDEPSLNMPAGDQTSRGRPDLGETADIFQEKVKNEVILNLRYIKAFGNILVETGGHQLSFSDCTVGSIGGMLMDLAEQSIVELELWTLGISILKPRPAHRPFLTPK